MIHRERGGGAGRTIRVWLPTERPDGVLYLMDGQNVFEGRRRATWRADEIAATLIERGAIAPIAIVGIDAAQGSRRWEEYLPYPDPHNARARRSVAGRFARVTIPAVMRTVSRRHPVLATVRRVAIGGSSYGAVAALYAAISQPGAFSALLVESAPLWVGDGKLIEDARAAGLRARVWIGVGTRESGSPEKSAELVRLARRLASALRTTSAVRLRVAADARHDENAWAARLPDALRWLFGA